MPPAEVELNELREHLTAYLDGELDADMSRRIEQMLSTDPRVRTELARLQQAWDMLDDLPRTPVDDSFTETTVEMVAVSAAGEIEHHEAAAPERKRRAALVVMAGAVLAGLIGYVVLAAMAPDANEQFLRDLPIIENLEGYRQVESVEFLRMLKDKELFDSPAAAAPNAASPEPAAAKSEPSSTRATSQ